MFLLVSTGLAFSPPSMREVASPWRSRREFADETFSLMWGRLRVSALALTEVALRPRAEFHSATEPPTLQFQQWVGLLIHALRHFTYARHILHLPKANFTSAKQIRHFRFAVGRLRVSALALTEDALRPRAELCSATEPPNLQFQQLVSFLASLFEGGVGKADGGSNSSLLTPNS